LNCVLGPLGSTKSVNFLIAQSISTVLVCTGRMEVAGPELEKLVDLLMQDLSVSDTVSEVGRVAREYMEAVALEKKLIQEENILNFYYFFVYFIYFSFFHIKYKRQGLELKAGRMRIGKIVA